MGWNYDGPEVVYSFVPAASDWYSVDLTGLSSDIDLHLLAACDPSTCMQTSDNAGSGNEHVLAFLDAATEYFFVVDGFNGNNSSYTLSLTCGCDDGDGDGVCDELDACDGDDASGDSDGDGVCDDVDLCDGDDASGDADGDGVCDDVDPCFGDQSTGDSDGDGVCDDEDACEGDDATGDSDGDGVCDDVDACPAGDDHADGDGDGEPDACDACPANAFDSCTFWCTDPYDAQIWEVTTSGLAPALPIGVTLDGSPAAGVNDLDLDPTTGVAYAIVENLSGSRFLTTLDLGTGAALSVGPSALTDRISSIAFDDVGLLYGLSGDGGSNPETLYDISKLDGGLSMLTALGAGGDGEVLAFNPDSGLLFHWSGLDFQALETIDPTTLAISSLPTVGALEEVFGAAWDGNTSNFLVADGDNAMARVSVAGAQTALGPLAADPAGDDIVCRGIAFAPSAP